VGRFPNLTVIDIDAVLDQVRGTADQVSTVVEVVFWFSLGAGVLVLMAAVSASQDERLLEGGVMRTLGGSRRQLRLAQASEFAAIGLLSGLVAAMAASVLAGVVAEQAFDLPWEPNWGMAGARRAACGTRRPRWSCASCKADPARADAAHGSRLASGRGQAVGHLGGAEAARIVALAGDPLDFIVRGFRCGIDGVRGG